MVLSAEAEDSLFFHLLLLTLQVNFAPAPWPSSCDQAQKFDSAWHGLWESGDLQYTLSPSDSPGTSSSQSAERKTSRHSRAWRSPGEDEGTSQSQPTKTRATSPMSQNSTTTHARGVPQTKTNLSTCNHQLSTIIFHSWQIPVNIEGHLRPRAQMHCVSR